MGKTYAVIGLGRFGTSVARTLGKRGLEVLAIDCDEAAVKGIVNGIVTQALQADGTDINALRAAGVRNCDVAIVAIGGDINASILSTLNCKELGIPHVVAKAMDAIHGKVLEKVGADRVVYPEREMGERVATSLASQSLLDYIELAPGYSIREIVAGGNLAGRSLRDLGLRVKLSLNVVVIRRGNGIVVSPGGDEVIRDGDALVVVGANQNLDRLEQYNSK